MHLHDFGLLVIILLLLTCISILFVICSMKIHKLLYGRYDKRHALPVHLRHLNSSLDPRTIQTRIKCLRKPYKRMKEFHAKNMPPIVEVNTPVDSDATVAEHDLEESNEKVAVRPSKEGGVSNYWKKDTVIIVQ